MGLPLPQQLRIPCAFLGALGIVTFALRCFVRVRIVKAWGSDDTFITLAFVCSRNLKSLFTLPSYLQSVRLCTCGTPGLC